MKKISRVLLAVAVFVLSSAQSVSAHTIASHFTDIQKDSLDYMYKQHVIDGYPDGTFRPLDNINRAELVKLLMSGANIAPDLTLRNCFWDVGIADWYVGWVCTAKEKGWIEGYPDGSFKPDNPVNKAEAAKIINGVLNVQVFDKVAHSFSDVPVKAWFFQYVNNLADLYYVDWNKSFLPAASINRGDVAEIVFRDILAKKLYEPLAAQGSFEQQTPPVKISEAESLALTARDFFRSIKMIEAMTFDQLTAAQDAVDAAYAQAKVQYTTFSSQELEDWNYKVMMEDGKYTYGVLDFYPPGREIPMVWRYSYDSYAILKFETASKKLVAYDFFTRDVDRPSLVPNIVSVKNDVVEVALGTQWPDPASLTKNGDRISFTLRDFR